MTSRRILASLDAVDALRAETAASDAETEAAVKAARAAVTLARERLRVVQRERHRGRCRAADVHLAEVQLSGALDQLHAAEPRKQR